MVITAPLIAKDFYCLIHKLREPGKIFLREQCSQGFCDLNVPLFRTNKGGRCTRIVGFVSAGKNTPISGIRKLHRIRMLHQSRKLHQSRVLHPYARLPEKELRVWEELDKVSISAHQIVYLNEWKFAPLEISGYLRKCCGMKKVKHFNKHAWSPLE